MVSERPSGRAKPPRDKNSYAQYLQIATLLSAQQLQTQSDDELLFIIIHQTHELWFKLAIHELECATKALMRDNADDGDCILSYKRLDRVREVQHLLIASWNVLTTLTPDEFHVFRETVGRDNASGFQSVQYRKLEFKLGLKRPVVGFERVVAGQPKIKHVRVLNNAETAEQRTDLENALRDPSIYDAVTHFMARRFAFPIDERTTRNDYSRQYQKSKRVFEAWLNVYQDRRGHPELYQLGEKLVDLEDAFRKWRFVHLATVARVIGSNSGTGGSSGLHYLKMMANQLIDSPMYPELWDVRIAMFSRGKRFDLANAGYAASGSGA